MKCHILVASYSILCLLANSCMLSRKMTSTNNNVSSVSLFLSVLCLGIVLMGGWYFQSSIVELRTLVANQQKVIMEQKKEITGQKNEILEQTAKVTKQEETVQQFNARLYEQSNKLDEMSLQLQFDGSHHQFQSKVNK